MWDRWLSKGTKKGGDFGVPIAGGVMIFLIIVTLIAAAVVVSQSPTLQTGNVTLEEHLEQYEAYYGNLTGSELIAEYYQLNGSINIQSRKQNNEFYIFEINPRISSTVFIRNHFNFQDLLWWICNLLDISYTLEEIKKSGIAVIGYTYNFYK